MTKKFDFKRFVDDNVVVVIFLVLTAIATPISGLSANYILQDIFTRIGRNSFLVFSLILPIMAGMGINFGMVLGAMAGQLGLIWAVDWNISGVWGLGFGVLIGLPIAIGLGIVCGSVLNRAKGREMATGYILGFFMDGVYQFVVLYLMGAIIPMRSAALTLSRGYGVRNTVNLDSVRQSLDKLLMVKAFGLNFPIATYLVIALLCVFIIWFRKTKLGQDMRAIGQDQPVSNASGIPVEKTRIIAIVMSTVLAMIGQIIFLQNMGNMATYNAHRQTGFFAAAAILVGGASVTKATIPNVFVGVVLLHLMYIVMPRAGAQLFGSAQIGEYFRDAFSYGAIALALVLHAWRKRRGVAIDRAGMRQNTVDPDAKGGVV
ncbi:MAG: ABC transporter permease [Spirochaetae bacterium HGW-Spirochaetae-3]|jgi:simple sugar transport system permease protein|nr:MAG: ABC transporter permease [Spirochaetae bacterium HGW-Spirochaetae-3]